MINKIKKLLSEVEASQASSIEEIEALRIKYLSKKGEISQLMADFRNVAQEEKKQIGQMLNELDRKSVV